MPHTAKLREAGLTATGVLWLVALLSMLQPLATDDFFRARLDTMIDLRHPLAVLATEVRHFGAVFGGFRSAPRCGSRTYVRSAEVHVVARLDM
jgi:hypothetical protein